MAWPNFLLIGAMRSGTSALYKLLGQHPQIYMSPVKEPNFFVHERGSPYIEGSAAITEATAYERLFAKVRNERAVGEGSQSYLYYSSAAQAIELRLPAARLLCILRNPVDRAYSHFLFHRAAGRESIKSFADALAAEPERIRRGIEFGHYVARGFY